MKEKLTCTQCGKGWRREKTRGRKPHQCPKCVKSQQQTPPPQKQIVQTQQITPKRKIKAKPLAAQANTNASHNEDEQEISVGKIYHYYHPTDDKLREETKGGSKWKCRCGYTLEIKFSVTATPTHKCTDNSKSVPMTRIDK